MVPAYAIFGGIGTKLSFKLGSAADLRHIQEKNYASLLNSSTKQVNCVGGTAGIEPTPPKSNDWTPLSPCQLGQGGGRKRT
jgi:hypothetical protein